MPKRNVGSQWKSFGVDLVLCMAGSENSSDLASRLGIFFSVLISSFSDTLSPHGRKDGLRQLSLLIFIVLVPQGREEKDCTFFSIHISNPVERLWLVLTGSASSPLAHHCGLSEQGPPAESSLAHPQKGEHSGSLAEPQRQRWAASSIHSLQSSCRRWRGATRIGTSWDESICQVMRWKIAVQFYLVLFCYFISSQVFFHIFIRLLHFFHDLSFHVLCSSVTILVVPIHTSSQCVLGLPFFSLLFEKQF